MGQIVKRKKKGRPPKADLGGREPPPPPERDLRRSLRRRNVKYVFDLDDYFDEDELFAEDEDQRRREKKLELLLKLQTGGESESTVAPQENRYRRVDHASVSSDDDEKPSKKRKIDGYINEDVDDENDEANEEDNYNYEDEEEVRVRKTDPKAEESPPGTPTEAPSGIPLPDKKALELILDKLQKKDIYGVYAEPVDPEELPDYHDIIEHPMDFATVRNKLGNGLYATFEQFESDVFLICSNAMQYNSPDTIYHKQARTIEELAKRKFQKIRLNVERTEKENKPEQKLMRSGSSSLKKQIKRSVSRTLQEPVGSDFSSGATLATTGDNQNFANAFQPVGSEKPDSIDGLVESNLFLNDNNLDKGEESLPGRGLLSRFGKKSFVPDENRRATYTISLSHPLAISDSIFSTFDGETKELVPVGLYSDHSYARSLARFAATLGSVAWKVASKRIEQALPQGFKFGQGWVGEYEPLPTPVLMLENCSIKEPPFLAKVQPRKLEKIPASSVTESPASVPSLEHKLPFLGTAGMRTPASASIITAQPIRGNSISETKQSFFLSPKAHPNGTHNLSHHHPSLQSRGFVEPDKKFQKNVELNAPPVNKNPADHIGNRQNSKSSENVNFSSSGSFQQSDSNGVAFRGLADGKIVGNKKMDGNTIVSSPNQGQGQGLSDPVQLMRQLSEKNALNQQKPSNRSSTEAPQVLPSFTTNDPNNAALAAARAWMSVGAGGFRPIVAENANKNQIYADSLYNSTRDAQSQVSRFRGEFHNSPVHAFVPQGPMPMMVGNEVQFQNQRMVFPQVATADLSRFGLQSSWQNISPQMQMRQKQESFPPDLNIGFQSSGSPGRPSSGVLVDSQQPDLALQL